jgi:hypothetical protein
VAFTRGGGGGGAGTLLHRSIAEETRGHEGEEPRKSAPRFFLNFNVMLGFEDGVLKMPYSIV